MSEAAAAKIDPEDTQDTEEAPEFEKAIPITQARFGLADESSNRWRVDVPMGVTPEQLLKDESYWRHVSQFLRPGDEITCMPDNMAWKLVLHVCGAGRLWAHVSQQALYSLEALGSKVPLPSIYDVKFQGSHHKWSVLREGKPLKDGFETETLARRYAQNHEAAVQR